MSNQLELHTSKTKKVRIVNRLDTSMAPEPIEPFITISLFEEKDGKLFADYQTITPAQAKNLVDFLKEAIYEAGY